MLKLRYYSVTFYLFIFFNFIFIYPSYAYLDPGSGSALLTSIISLLAGLLFTLRRAFYKMFFKKVLKSNSIISGKIIIFNDSAIYWNSYSKIVKLLIKYKIHFQYYTFDKNDKGLLIDSQYMHSRYLFNNLFGLAKWKKINGNILLTTTPHIGSKGYLVRPVGVKKLVHFFHSITDIGYYKKYSLDAFDEVLLAGTFQTKSIRSIEHLRNLKQKQLIEVGLPYFDNMLENINYYSITKKKKTILIASSWGNKGILKNYGTKFAIQLSQAGYEVIIRPHPHSFKVEFLDIKKYQKLTSFFKSISWDHTCDPTRVMNEADLLISDTSSIRFDFAFIFNKPVITLEIPEISLSTFEINDLKESWNEDLALKIGEVIKYSEVSTIVKVVSNLLNTKKESQLLLLRNEYIANINVSADKVVSYLRKQA